MYKILLPLIVSLALTITGCVVNKSSGFQSKEFEARDIQSVYVAHQPKDTAHLNLLIKAELEEKGYVVETGAMDDMPKHIDGLVTYVDKWVWDFKSYMYELTILLKNPETKYPIALGHSLHGSLSKLTPVEMVKEATTNMIGEKNE